MFLLKYILSALSFLMLMNQSFAQSKSEKIQQLVNDYKNQNLFNGSILVAAKGEVVYKNGVGMANIEWSIPNTSQTKFRVGSITKQFTSMLIMQLVNEGKIDLQKPITAYLTNYRRETGDSITIHHLLTHSSGIPNYTDNTAFAKISKLHFALDDFIRMYCSGDPEFKPGSRFSYSNSGYFILGAIIEAVTKKAYNDVLQERILDVVGMRNTGYDFSQKIITNRASGYEKMMNGYINAEYLDMGLPYAAGSLYSTVEDLFLWNNALYKKELLSDSLKKIMFSPTIDAWGAAVAYGWFVRNIPTKDSAKKIEMIWHSGGINGFLSELARFPNEQNFIAILDNAGGATSSLLQDVINILYELPAENLKPSFISALSKKIIEGSVNVAWQYYRSLGKEEKEKFDFRGAEKQINTWGYQLLNDKKNVGDALKMFEINVLQFPNSSNVYDSYAEALMNAGNFPMAIENYKKSLQLDSANNNANFAKAMISGMQAKPDTLRIMVDGHEMVLYKTGNKGPVVVLEAGGNSDHRSWNSIVPELSKTMTVITYDRPGYLSSQSCAYPRTANRVATELKEALIKAGIKGPYVVGGWSWGGAFARAFAAKFPGDTKGVLLVDPAFGEVYQQMATQYPDAFTRSFSERIGNNQAAEDEFDAMMPTMVQADKSDEMYHGKTELLIAGSYRGWENDKPSKKIWIDELVNWSKANPNVRHQVVDAGHAIQFEKPEVVIEAIKRLAN